MEMTVLPIFLKIPSNPCRPIFSVDPPVLPIFLQIQSCIYHGGAIDAMELTVKVVGIIAAIVGVTRRPIFGMKYPIFMLLSKVIRVGHVSWALENY